MGPVCVELIDLTQPTADQCLNENALRGCLLINCGKVLIDSRMVVRGDEVRVAAGSCCGDGQTLLRVDDITLSSTINI